MTRPAGPLPGVAQRAPRAMTGAWRATVERVSPALRVAVPELVGQGVTVGLTEAVPEVNDPTPLAPGDRVWVTCIEGDASQLLITHRRA